MIRTLNEKETHQMNKYNIKAIRSYEVFGINKVGECHMYDQDYICYEKKL